MYNPLAAIVRLSQAGPVEISCRRTRGLRWAHDPTSTGSIACTSSTAILRKGGRLDFRKAKQRTNAVFSSLYQRACKPFPIPFLSISNTMNTQFQCPRTQRRPSRMEPARYERSGHRTVMLLHRIEDKRPAITGCWRSGKGTVGKEVHPRLCGRSYLPRLAGGWVAGPSGVT